jgi:hypothetical protein
MRQFFIRAVHVGTMQLLLCFGTALLSGLFPAWRNLLMSRRGVPGIKWGPPPDDFWAPTGGILSNSMRC